MNEYFAVEPSGYRNADQLRRLLDLFGTETGRYIAGLPARWIESVREDIEGWPEIEKHRVKRLLEKARERAAVIRRADLNGQFDPDSAWKDNVVRAARAAPAPPLAGAVVTGDPPAELPQGLTGDFFHRIDAFEPPAADETVRATPDEYLRVSEVLLRVSDEILLVDPFLDPTRKDRGDVMRALLRGTGSGKCRRFVMFVRGTEMKDIPGIAPTLKGMLRDARTAVREVAVVLCDDKPSAQPLHARYLLSKKGALRFEYGFQEFNKRKVDVSPVGGRLHDELLRSFLERNLPFTTREIVVRV